MHANSMTLMAKFVKDYLDAEPGQTVLDVGSYNVNGTYRELLDGHHYTGGDIEDGPNVDAVFPGLYDFGIRLYDVVISGQCLEHVEDTKEWIRAVDSVLKPDGLVCIIAPNSIHEHKFPIDCWRIYPDGMKWLFGVAGWEVLDIRIEGPDTIGVGRKGS